jgi:acetyl esterase/lipase
MGILNVVKLSALLARIARDPEDDARHPKVIDQIDNRTPSDLRYDVYRPLKKSLACVIVLHGMTINGKEDRRLKHFARTLARSNITSVVPHITGLARCEFNRDDLDTLTELLRVVHQETGQRIGLIGFSFGGGYALAAAERASTDGWVRFVLTFGAHYSLSELFGWYMEKKVSEKSSPSEWDNWIYLNLVLAYRYQKPPILPPEEFQEVETLMQRYCCEASLDEKSAFYEKHLRAYNLVEKAYRELDPSVLEALSPSGKLGRLKCKVSVIHDLHDTLIPASHSERIFAELQDVAFSTDHRLLVTSLLSHVSMADFFKVSEVARLYSAMKPILSTED